MRMASSALPCARQFACLAEARSLSRARCWSCASILAIFGSLGLIAAQTIQRVARTCRPRPSACSPWPGRPGLQCYWDRREESAATVWTAMSGRPRDSRAWAFSTKDGARGIGRRSRTGFFWARPIWSASNRQPATIETLSPSPAANPHQRFHSTFSSPAGPNRNLPSR